MTAQTDKPDLNVNSVRANQDPQRILTRSAIGSIIALVVQYILGMINNFFVKFPDTTERVKLWTYALTRFTEVTHIIIGFLLLLSAPVFLIRSIKAKQQTWVIASAIGLAGIVIAFAGGVLFVTTQADPYSLVMSYAFLLSLAGYGWGLYSAKKI